MSTAFEIFLLELAQVLHFPNLAPDAQGACLIIMKEGNVPLLFEFDEQLVPNTVLVSTPVAPVPIDHRADVYEAILIGNGTIENTLSVKPDEDMLYLHRRFHPAIQAAELEILLKKFLENIREWGAKLETISKQPPRSRQKGVIPPAIQVFPYKA